MATDIIELKTGQFSAIALTINSSSLTTIKRALSRKVKSSSIFFKDMSVVLSFTPSLEKINLVTLKSHLTEYGINVIGVTDWQNNLQKEVLTTAGLVPLGQTLQSSDILPEYRYIPPLILERDIENGEVIYAKSQDLLIYGDVKEGAEILADGNIHVYGRLQGKATAGVNTNNGVIYTQSLEAEFISVNQRFLHKENLPDAYWLQPVRIISEKSGLIFQPLLKS
ncbi:septum site-determining protein MinC [Cricetibacter osteomyelitidis]|uniref:Probable septum site-determining protein MinC n=1 Tax=Cricetibacter osteomyelitidis TaxID=1521931 RepID=A0A4R2SV33_9PAST|nr:septum site-determining protein MinC [Cricetibacter osteomyelitidis]TCP92204.1 septum site-determining protein MinC [Cricetibacter osteomyelitidis]